MSLADDLVRAQAASAASFAAAEAIRSGQWDDHLIGLALVIKERQRELTPPPMTPEMIRQGQVWVWIQGGPGVVPRWEVRGTGVTGL